jgi:outer membrane receptor for ferrienterochelin and colicins
MKKIIMLLFLAANFTLAYAQEQPKDTITEQELDEVILQSVRTGRTIRNTPTRVETIDAEELEEKANMQVRAGVTMILHESTGLQVQQTSATSGNASIRVQGLDGRYTQLLKDGYPNFGNFASGLSLLEIPPLDLKQVEIIKGPASTLYGGGAIAGAINFVSKRPQAEQENVFLLNQSHLGQSTLGFFSTQRKRKFGYSLLLMTNFQNNYDVDHDGFSELPESASFSIDPKFYFFPSEKTMLMIGNTFTKGKMTGGDMDVINGNADAYHTYFEKNETIRNTTTIELDHKVSNGDRFKIKQSLSLFDRKINIPNYIFSGLSTNTYTDASFVFNLPKQTLITGLNLVYDGFEQKTSHLHDSRSFTIGAYVQHTWDISEKIKLENGIRIDRADLSTEFLSDDQVFVLPKMAALFRFNNEWSSRIGGGLGYKMPGIFTEKTEEMQYRMLFPLKDVEAEKSIGATADVNFNKRLSDHFSLSINHMFYLTKIEKPLVLEAMPNGFAFANASEAIISKGFETNFKLIFKGDFKLFAGYTFTDAKAGYLSGNQFLPLLPKYKLNLALIHEKENNFKIGLEGYFTDKQFLTNGNGTPSFWELGFMAQKTLWNHFDFFVNFENFTNVRQSSYNPVVNGSHDNPSFDEIWTHTEGFVFNGGVKIRF